MIKANELRIGSLITWNPALLSPNSTLPPMYVEVSAIMPDKISYVFPNIENRVEPFEDDEAQKGVRYKSLEELEPIILTVEILQNCGFKEEDRLMTESHFEKADLQLIVAGNHFERLTASAGAPSGSKIPIKCFHELQNLYFAMTGEELEIKLHGQQT